MAYLKSVLLCLCYLLAAVRCSEVVDPGSLEDEAPIGDASLSDNFNREESVANGAPVADYHCNAQPNEPASESDSSSDYGDMWTGNKATDTSSESDTESSSDDAADASSDDDCLYNNYYDYDEADTSESSEGKYRNVGPAQVTTNEAPQVYQ